MLSRAGVVLIKNKFRLLLLFDHYFYKVDYRGFCGRHKYALVAQLDRVSDSDSEGRWFESSQARQ